MIKTSLACNSFKIRDWFRFLGWFAFSRKKNGISLFKQAIADYFEISEDSVFPFGAARMGLYSFLHALDKDERNEVIVPGYTCVVVTNAIKYAGYKAVYVDIDESDLNIDLNLLKSFISDETKAIVIPHNFGITCEYIDSLKEAYPEIYIIEDAAHTFGSVTKTGEKTGLLGHASILSLEYSKPISTGAGGVLIVNDKNIRSKIQEDFDTLSFYPRFTNFKIFASLSMNLFGSQRLTAAFQLPLLGILYVTGLLFKASKFEIEGGRPVHYPVKLSPNLAYIGYLQAREIKQINLIKSNIVKEYHQHVKGIPGITDFYSSDYVYVRYPILFDRDIPIKTIEEIKRRLRKTGVQVGVWFNDVVHPKGSFRYCYLDGACKTGESVSNRIINLPVSINTKLNKKELNQVRRIFEELLNQ